MFGMIHGGASGSKTSLREALLSMILPSEIQASPFICHTLLAKWQARPITQF